MKVELSTVRPYALSQTRSVGLSKTSNVTPPANNVSRTSSMVHISFKGNPKKNLAQVASIAAEDKGIGLSSYSKGGLGVVAKELPESLNKERGFDVRTFVPYHSHNNPDGKIKVLKIEHDAKGKRVDAVEPEKFKTVDLNYKLKEGESFVIQGPPQKGKSKFVEIKATGIEGSIERISPDALKEEKVPYRLFKVVNSPVKDGVTRYVMHTQELARFSESYGGAAYGAYGGAYSNGGGAYSTRGIGAKVTSDAAYGESNRAIIDALKKMANSSEKFNPGNILTHDRTAFSAIAEIASLSAAGDSYFTGLRVDGRYHNPGRAYQGVYEDPFTFFRIMAGKNEIAALKKSKHYPELMKLDEKVRAGKATKQEIERAKALMKPFIGGFVDDLGTYNVTMTPLLGSKINPNTITSGTVSLNYGKEITDPNTRDMAEGLIKQFAGSRLINITNGSSAVALELDNPEAKFGRGNNGLTDAKKDFHTYAPKLDEKGVITNMDEVLAAKQENKKWLINLIAHTDTQNDPHAMQRLFFEEEAIFPKDNTRPSTVIGKFSEFKEGDKLIVGWGRPDPQKGYPTTFEAFYKFLKDPSISDETKQHTKLLVGAGGNTWDEDASDWKKIQETIKKIRKMDNGKYDGNVMYVNGMFPNRLAGCADFSIFTSRYEPCGITPLESYMAGTPVISINTGGAPDFINGYTSSAKSVTSETGFLTKNPYLRNPEAFGLERNSVFEAVDNARLASSSDEVATCIKDALSLDSKDYKTMAGNALSQKVGWHQNASYNRGMSGIDVYATRVFGVDPTTKASIVERDNKPMKNLFSEFVDNAKETTKGAIKTVMGSKFGKIAAIAIGATAFAGAAIYMKRKSAKNALDKTA